jgi:hypothetical protein
MPGALGAALIAVACGAKTGLSVDLESDGSSPADGAVEADAGRDVPPERDADVTDVREDAADDAASYPDCFLLQERDPVRLGTGPDSSSIVPRTVWTGEGWAVLWLEGNEERTGEPGSWYALVRGDAPEAGPLEIIASNHIGPSGVWARGELAICWGDVDRDRTLFARLARDGSRVAPDVTLFAAEPFGCALRTASDGFAAFLRRRGAGEQLLLARLDPAGTALADPVVLFENESGAYLTYSILQVDDGYAIAWTEEVEGPTELNVQRFDPTGWPLGPRLTPVPEARRPFRPTLSRVGSVLALAWSSDEDEAPVDGWAVWLATLGPELAPASAPVHVADTSTWERPAVLGVGDRVLVATVEPAAEPALRLVRLELVDPVTGSGGAVPFRGGMPAGAHGGPALATGAYWGDVGLVFEAYDGEPRTEVFFTSFTCGE